MKDGRETDDEKKADRKQEGVASMGPDSRGKKRETGQKDTIETPQHTILMRDVILALERDGQLARSPLLFRLYEREEQQKAEQASKAVKR